jgi:hypothetical protein
MSEQPLFVLAYLGGAAALAAWVDVRLAERRPTTWGMVGIAIAASMLIDANIGAVLHLTVPIVSVMVFGFAALVFSLLVCLWTLRMLRSAMPA